MEPRVVITPWMATTPAIGEETHPGRRRLSLLVESRGIEDSRAGRFPIRG